MEENEFEAKIKGIVFWCYMTQSGTEVDVHANLFYFAGVSVDKVQLEQAECNLDERVYWFGLPISFVILQKENINSNNNLKCLLTLLMQQ